jgi:predicted phage tail protein
VTDPLATPPRPPRRSLGSLLSDIPRILTELVDAEIASLKAEISSKLKAAGIGAGLLAGAGVIGFFASLVLLAAAILALAIVLPAWAAALIVGGALLLIAGILAGLGVAQLKRGLPPTPTETIDSVTDDLRTLRGERKESS